LGVTTVTWTVTDGAGNTATCAQTVTVTDNQNPTIVCPSNLSANTDAGLCTATISLGAPVTADNCTVAGVSNDAPAAFPVGTTTVTWTVLDAAGHSATCAQTVTVTDIQVPVALCQNITVNLTSTGSVTVPWTSVDNGSSDNCSIALSVLSPSTFTCSDFGINNVTLTITDNAGNSSSCAATVTIAGAPLTIASPVITEVDCFGNTTGDIDLTVNGGAGAVTFDWDNDGTGDADDNEDLTSVAAGTYTIVVTDAASCSITQTFTVTQPAALVVSTSVTDASCFGYSDGSATAAVSGGTGPYQYAWTTGSITNAASLLSAGPYTVTVTDSAGCTATSTATVNEPAQVVPVITGPASVCYGQSVTLTASGGTTYLWSTGGTSSAITVSPLTATTYTVTASVGLCTGTTTYSLAIDPLPVAIISGDSILCTGETSTLNATGGNTYTWSDGTTGVALNIDNGSAGNIYVVAANGCGTDTAYVTVVNDIVSAVDAGTDQTIGIGQTVTLEPSGGVSYSWSPPDGLSCVICENPVAMPLQTTTYIVTSQDQYGCTVTDEVIITVETTTSVLLPDIFSPDGNGVNDVLLVRGTGIQGMVFRLYDRWGQKVFESLDQSMGWDGTFHGKPLDTGVFVYTLTGTFYTGETFEKKGNITLKR
jgi:gliding motility-associated-like protein